MVREGDYVIAFYATGAVGAAFDELGTFAVGKEPVKLYRITRSPMPSLMEL